MSFSFGFSGEDIVEEHEEEVNHPSQRATALVNLPRLATARSHGVEELVSLDFDIFFGCLEVWKVEGFFLGGGAVVICGRPLGDRFSLEFLSDWVLGCLILAVFPWRKRAHF